MNFEIELAGRQRHVEITRDASHASCSIDDRHVDADVAELSSGVCSILIAGRSFEVHIEPQGENLRIVCDGHQYIARVNDPRRYRRGSGTIAAEGRQEVVAVMPGKVIRLLVKAGDAVESGQGLLVVEAMKMQNEIRAQKSGVVERLQAVEGQTVNAGDVLLVVS